MSTGDLRRAGRWRAAVVLVVTLAGGGAWRAGSRMALETGFAEALATFDPPPLSALTPPAAGAFEMSVVTLNVWDPPVWIPGNDRAGRLPRLPARLAASAPDLIVLQEAYRLDLREFLGSAFAGSFSRSPARPVPCTDWRAFPRNCTGGLMTLSRYPVLEERFLPHPLPEGARPDEILGRKGVLLTTVDTPLGSLHVLNVHLYAGRGAPAAAVRVAQVRSLYRFAVAERLFDRPVLLLGDLNSGPSSPKAGTVPDAYRLLTDELGFVDTGRRSHAPGLTWDPVSNRYARGPFGGTGPARRIDHVLVRWPEGCDVAVVDAGLTAPDEPPVSDHRAYSVVLTPRAQSVLCSNEIDRRRQLSTGFRIETSPAAGP